MKLFDFLTRKNNKIRSHASRKAPRFPVNATVILVLENGAVAQGRLEDMSTGGAFMTTRDRPFGLEKGEEGDLGLNMPPKAPEAGHRFPCTVVRILPKGVALRFLTLQEDDIGKLYPEDFLE